MIYYFYDFNLIENLGNFLILIFCFDNTCHKMEIGLTHIYVNNIEI